MSDTTNTEQAPKKTPLEEAQERLKAAQERRNKASEAAALAKVEAEIRATEREAEEEEFLTALCERVDGELGVDFDFLRFGDFLIAVKRPVRLAQDLWNKKVQAAKNQVPDGSEVRNYVKRCLVPNEGEGGEKAAAAHFDVVAERFPDAPLLLANLCNMLAQGGVARRQGK